MSSERIVQTSLPGEFQEINAKALETEKRAVLARYFTNLDGEVRAIKNTMPPVVAAALVARFSRADQPDPTELFWNEFVETDAFGTQIRSDYLRDEEGINEVLASSQARKMIKRILDKFGDDSVREDASGYVLVKNVPVLTAIEAFQNPLVVGIEASTRYIEWDKPDPRTGQYRYTRSERIMDSPFADLYVETADNLFNAYAKLWQPMWAFVERKNPKEDGVSELAYKTAVKGRVCDNLRKLLPLGIQTNFGIHATYRTFSDLSMNMQASTLPESQKLGRQIAEELYQVNPEFIEVALNKRGAQWAESRTKMADAIAAFSKDIVYENPSTQPPGTQVYILNQNYLLDLVGSIVLHAHPALTKEKAHEIASQKIEKGEHLDLFAQIGEARTNRRHKVPEVLNSVVVMYRYNGISFSGYKDLNRHRNILYKTEPDFSADQGFYTPDEIHEAGGIIEDVYREAQERAIDAYHTMFPLMGVEARKILTHGTRTTFSITMGLAQAYWIDELRSIASGDPEYRRYAQEGEMLRNSLMPDLSGIRSFVDKENYSLNRIREAVRADLLGAI